jgi:hypothetical protein
MTAIYQKLFEFLWASGAGRRAQRDTDEVCRGRLGGWRDDRKREGSRYKVNGKRSN